MSDLVGNPKTGFLTSRLIYELENAYIELKNNSWEATLAPYHNYMIPAFRLFFFSKLLYWFSYEIIIKFQNCLYNLMNYRFQLQKYICLDLCHDVIYEKIGHISSRFEQISTLFQTDNNFIFTLYRCRSPHKRC